MYQLFIILACVLSTSTTFAISPLQHNEAIFSSRELRHHFLQAQAGAEDDKIVTTSSITPRYRLPGVVVPRHYRLFLRPVLEENDPDGAEQFTTPGNVTITIECVKQGNVITMHAAELEIDESSVVVTKNGESEPLTVTAQLFEPINQTYQLVMEQNLEVGVEYDVSIVFMSYIADPLVRMNGIYRSSYITDEGDRRYVATTQFSRTLSVRKSFPSFDEPNQKARFTFTIGRSEIYHTLSNMNLLKSIPMDGNLSLWSWDVFETTPIMPATVIAFVVSDFSNETAPPDLYNPDKPVKIWGPPPMMRDNAANFSVNVAARTLKFFEDYFGIEYELPKIDSAAMPDFAAGAMENWGLNIYRTTFLLWYRGETPMSTKYSSGQVIAHELAHQWWGNLVTHTWWNDWWLTEGTASYFEYIGFQAVEPSFETKNRIVCDDIQPAMEFDIGPTSVPIHGPISDRFVENPSVINYQKGASIVRMLQAMLSESIFNSTLVNYLEKRKYTAVDQDIFFNDLTEYLVENDNLPINGKTIKEILDTWTLQTGFPIVRVSRASNSLVFISQERFKKFTLTSNSPVSSEIKAAKNSMNELDPNDLWHVPIGYVQASDPEPKFDEPNIQPKLWIDKTETLISYNLGNTNEWLVLNGDARSYYRTLYDVHFENLLRNELESNLTGISIASRSQLVDDYFVMTYERYVTPERALNMTRFLKDETEYVVWIPAFRHLRKCLHLFSSLDEATWTIFETYIKSIIQTPLDHVVLRQPPAPEEDPSPMQTIFRVPLLDWACTVRNEDCLAYASELVTAWLDSTEDPKINPVPVDIRASIYCGAVANGNEVTWNFIMDQYKATGSSDGLLLNALACTNNNQRLQSILDMSIANGTDIPRSAAMTAIQRVAMNSEGRALVISFLGTNLVEIITHFGNPSAITSIVSTLTSYIATDSERSKIETIVADNAEVLESQLEALTQHLATIALNINWFENVGQRMLIWFDDYNKQP